MKKKAFIVLCVAGTMMFCLDGCGSKDALRLENGIVSWEATKNAVQYEVQLDDMNDVCSETSWDLSSYCKYEGEHSISVSALNKNGKETEIGTLDIIAEKLAKPALAVEDSEGEMKRFVWTADENVHTYVYDLHDGQGKRYIKPDKKNKCQVEFPGINRTIITVTADGTSKDNVVYMDSEVTFEYEGTKVFNLANLANYPFYFTSRGVGGLEEFAVGTTLNKGTYKLDFTLYLMDSNGNSLTGNGVWGRRITDAQKDIWFCSTAISGYPGSDSGIPEAITATTYSLDVNVNKYGEAILSMGDFKANEMVVVADVVYNGKSVMAEKAVAHEDEKNTTFDTTKLEDFVAVYRGVGDWMTEANKEKFEFSIPTDLKDGVYLVELTYQLMDGNGGKLSGNGLWGRRITDESMTDMAWCTEFDLGSFKGIDIPNPDQSLTSQFTVTVKGRRFKVLCLDFNTGEIVAVSKVKKISGSSEKFDTSKLSLYKNVFVSAGAENTDTGSEQFRVETTRKQRGQIEVDVTYYVMNQDGYMLAGNGTWGRRMLDEGADEIWLCVTGVDGHADSKNTVPSPTEAVTRKMTVTLNNKGRFFLDMYDFMKGETVVITDIQYNGQSIIAK